MQITTSKEKTFDIQFIGALLRNSNRAMIELKDDRPINEIAADFDGLTTITKTDALKPSVKEVFEGFTQLVGIQRNEGNGTVLLTLEKGDAA